MTKDDKRLWNRAIETAAKIAEQHKKHLGELPPREIAIQRMTCAEIAAKLMELKER